VKNPLKFACVCGLALSVMIGAALALAAALSGGGEDTTFSGRLTALDALLARGDGAAGAAASPGVERLFAQMERQAATAGETLSLLKRRRVLALRDAAFLPAYEEAADAAAARYPFSAEAAACALEALVLSDRPDKTARAGRLVTALTGSDFLAASFLARTVSGAFSSPARAAEIPGLLSLLIEAQVLFPRSAARRAALDIDAVILSCLKGNAPGAEPYLAELLAGTQGEEGAANPEVSSRIRRFAAEFYYDYEGPRAAAETLAASSEPGDIAFRADALYLSGDIAGARAGWRLLASGPEAASLSAPVPPDIRLRALYNLAATAAKNAGPGTPAAQEERAALDGLFAEALEETRDPGAALSESALYGLLLYTRGLDAANAAAVLSDSRFKASPLLELELLRRRLEILPAERRAPEVWLLLGRRPESEAVLRWAVWYFGFQRLYEDEALALKEAVRRGFQGAWVSAARAAALLREGGDGVTEGERLLEGVPSDERDWTVTANLARVREHRKEFQAALAGYERAASMLHGGGNRRAEAAVQVRVARCLSALNRPAESRRALEYALDLDPDNLDALSARRAGFLP
jgi:hypothetical protein